MNYKTIAIAGGMLAGIGLLGLIFRKKIYDFVMDLRSENNLKGVHPNLVRVLRAAAEAGAKFIVTDGVRTTAQQQALYAQGRTTAGSIVTQCDGVIKKSNHQVKSDGYGYAVDMYPDLDGNGVLNTNELNSTTGLQALSKIILQKANELGIKVTWGGNFTSFKDYPHFELG